MRIIKTKHPEKAKILTIADAHFSPTSPPAWNQDYWTLSAKTVDQLWAFVSKQSVDLVLWPGDLFHKKSPSKNPLNFLIVLIELLNRAGVPHAGVAGNHDLRGGSLQAGLKGQPLELLIKAKIFHLLDEEDILLQSDTHTTRITGRSWEHSSAESMKQFSKGTETYLVAAGHFWFGATDGIKNGERIHSPKYFEGTSPDVYVLGHHHEDQGVVEQGGKMFVVPGAATLTGAHEADVNRRPAAALLETTIDGTTAKIVRPVYPKLEDLVDMALREVLKQERKELKEFTDLLASAKPTENDPHKILNELAPPEEVKARVEELLERAEDGARK